MSDLHAPVSQVTTPPDRETSTDRRESEKALVEGISTSEQFTLTSNYLHFVGEKSKK